MTENQTIFSPGWLKQMNEKARKCRQEQGGPEVITGYYAARKVKDKWMISNGRTWWNDPVVVHEIHEYPDGTVCTANYIEGVQLFSRHNVEYSGMRAVRPAELPDLLGVAKVVYFDHRKTDEKGRALRVVHDMRETEVTV